MREWCTLRSRGTRRVWSARATLLRGSGVYHNMPPRSTPDAKAARDAPPLALDEEVCATLPLGVARARATVRMRFLIGAAPVCYGLPVSCR